MKKENATKNSVVMYHPKRGAVDFRVRVEKDTVWLSQKDMAELFGKNIRTVNEHIKNIFKEGELKEKTVIRNFRITASDGKQYDTLMYNLDVIISVGYRVKSQEGTRFRVWATSVLKKYLLEGYAVNKKQLEKAREQFTALEKTVHFLSGKIGAKTLQGKERDVFALLSEYAKTLSVLEQYDADTLKKPKGVKTHTTLSYETAIQTLTEVRMTLIKKGEATDLFAHERGREFAGIIRGLYQTFGGKELYVSIEEKAAHLLYFIIKDHPFSDGNKRSASFLFVYFLDLNNHLYKKNGEKKINDNALAALALLVAESDPKEKDTMVKLTETLIAE